MDKEELDQDKKQQKLTKKEKKKLRKQTSREECNVESDQQDFSEVVLRPMLNLPNVNSNNGNGITLMTYNVCIVLFKKKIYESYIFENDLIKYDWNIYSFCHHHFVSVNFIQIVGRR